MTKKQTAIAKMIRETGVCVLRETRGSQSMRTARSMAGLGYLYFSTGGYVAIGHDRVVCKMNCIWANMYQAGVIAQFDAVNMPDGTPKTDSHREWYQEYMVASAIVDQLGIPYTQAVQQNRDMDLRISQRRS